MIRTINIQLHAAHPEVPLIEATTFVGSPSAVFVRDVPKTVGLWRITAVKIVARYPDGTTPTVECVKGASGVWAATLPATASPGRVKCGLKIAADGIDENGNAVTGYVLGIADFAVYTLDATIQNVGRPEVTSVNGQTGDVTVPPYTLPPATTTTLGGIKVGENLTIEPDGTLNAEAGGGGGYPPPDGIPKGDLSSDVQASLDKADTAFQKPSGGIPSTDLSNDVQTSLGKADSAIQIIRLGTTSIVLSGTEVEFPISEPTSDFTLHAAADAFQTWLMMQSHARFADTMRFSARVAYAVGDVVFYNGSFWRCKTAHPVGTWIASHFTEVLGLSTVVNDVVYPTASTPASGDDSTKVATTAFVQNALPYAITTVYDDSGYFVVSDRCVNRFDATSFAGATIYIVPPDQTAGKSRDFYVAVTCGATVPSVAVVGAFITYTLINAKGGTPDLTLTANATTVLRFTEVANGSTGVNPVFVVTGGANGGGSIDPAALNAKANSTALAPDWRAGDVDTAYAVNNYITYNGNAYVCMVAYTATSSSPTPDQDIYNDTVTPATGHWKLTDMTTPDATLDITSAGSLRVVSAGGQTLWQQGYDLKTASSATLDNEAVNKYDFAANATANVSLTLPTPPTDKVGDFVLDVTNPALDTANFTQSAFSDAATYAVGAEVVYDSKIWRCVTAVSTAGAWTGTTNWEEAWPYFSIAGLSSTLEMVVPKGENLSEILSFAPGTRCELYFTLTSFAVNSHPTWKVVRQDVEVAA